MKLLLLAASFFSSKATPATATGTSTFPSSASLAVFFAGAGITHWTLRKDRHFKIKDTARCVKADDPTDRRKQWNKRAAPSVGIFTIPFLLSLPVFAARIGSHMDQIGPISYARTFAITFIGMINYGIYRCAYEKSRGYKTPSKKGIRSGRWSRLIVTTAAIGLTAAGCHLKGI